MFFGSLVLWVGVPVAWLWIGSRIQPSGGLATAVGAMMIGMLLTIAHFIFAFHFGLMLLGLGRAASMPTFLNPQEEEAVKDHI